MSPKEDVVGFCHLFRRFCDEAAAVMEHLRRIQSCFPRRFAASVAASVWMWSAALVACAGTPQAPGSTEPTRTARVTHVNSGIAIDGVLNEPLWNNAPTMGDLIQREPHPGDSPTEKTEVKLLYDAHYLYIGVMCYDLQAREVI